MYYTTCVNSVTMYTLKTNRISATIYCNRNVNKNIFNVNKECSCAFLLYRNKVNFVHMEFILFQYLIKTEIEKKWSKSIIVRHQSNKIPFDKMSRQDESIFVSLDSFIIASIFLPQRHQLYWNLSWLTIISRIFHLSKDI